MHLKTRIKLLERQRKQAADHEPGSSPAAARWLATLTTEELIFLHRCKISEEFFTANRTKYDQLGDKFDEFKKTIEKS